MKLQTLTFAALTFAVLLSGCARPEETPVAEAGKPQIVWMNDITEARKESELTGKPMMVMFTSSSCGYCRQMKAETLVNPSVVDNSAKFVAVEVKTDEDIDTAQFFGISSVPVVSFISPKGTEVVRVQGFVEAPEFRGAMDQAIDDIADLKEEGAPADGDAEA